MCVGFYLVKRIYFFSLHVLCFIILIRIEEFNGRLGIKRSSILEIRIKRSTHFRKIDYAQKNFQIVNITTKINDLRI